MPQPFNPNQPQVPPDVLEAMLGLSEQDEEQKLLDKQLAMGQMLGKQATGYQGHAAGFGGALSAAAQGLAGYGAGSKLGAYDQMSQAGMSKRKGQRKSFFDWMNPQKAPGDDTPELLNQE